MKAIVSAPHITDLFLGLLVDWINPKDSNSMRRSLSKKRYAAFVSYSQKDAKYAKKLHRSLEAYRIPSETSGLDKNTKLGRIFRDDDELAAADSLGAALEGAILDSKNLIVICSPNSARSPWVDMEVRQFKRRGEGRVFAVIVSGMPHSGSEDTECFCPALKERVSAAGELTGERDEPLAPRWNVDGLARTTTRIAAGIFDVSFDDLWRRDVRRRRQKLSISAFGALVITAVTIGLVYGWISEREIAKEQQNAATMRSLVKATGEGRTQFYAENLSTLTDISETRRFEEPLRKIASWLRPIRDEIASIQVPRILEFQGQFYFFDDARGLSAISEISGRPQRIVQPNTKTLIVIGSYRTLVLDLETGSILSSQAHSDVTFKRHAFQSPNGSTVVLGVRYGSTNGSVVYSMLRVSADGTEIDLQGVGGLTTLEAVWVGSHCNNILIKGRDGETKLYAIRANGFADQKRPTGSREIENDPDLIEIWVSDPSDERRQNIDPFISDLNEFGTDPDLFLKSTSCSAVLADSAHPARTSPLTAIVPIGGQDGSPTDTEWKFIAAAEAPPLYQLAATQREDIWFSSPNDIDLFFGNNLLRNAPPPRGVPQSSKAFDNYKGQSITLGRDFANAGVVWHVCGIECVEIPVLHSEDTSYEVLRSPDGRYLFFAQAGTILDLSDFQLKTGIRELPSRGNWAFDFDPDDNHLAFVLGGEIIKYGPSGDTSMQWRRTDRSASAVMRSSDGQSDAYVGLVALGRDHFVAGEKSGRVTRLNENGAVEWQITFAGLGDLVSLKYSASRTLAALIGTGGVRVIELKSGLALSGLLVPPSWPEYRHDIQSCLSGVFLSDEGHLTVQCFTYAMDEPVIVSWVPSLYEGDTARWLEEVGCPSIIDETGLLDRISACSGLAPRR